MHVQYDQSSYGVGWVVLGIVIRGEMFVADVWADFLGLADDTVNNSLSCCKNPQSEVCHQSFKCNIRSQLDVISDRGHILGAHCQTF